MALLRTLWTPRARPPLTVAEALRRAEQRRRDGRYTEAGALVERALALEPANLHAHLLAAYLHVARRAAAPAKDEFHWVLGRDPHHPRSLLGLARIALEEGDVRGAEDFLRRALRFYPDFPEATALMEVVRGRADAPPSRATASGPARVERLRLPGLGRALLVATGDGAVIGAQPSGDDATAVATATAHTLGLAAAALARAGLGPLHRAIVEDDHDAVFTRTDGRLIVSLALPRATDPRQGLLDVNRLWSAAQHELGVGAAAPAVSSLAPADTVAADSTRRAS